MFGVSGSNSYTSLIITSAQNSTGGYYGNEVRSYNVLSENTIIINKYIIFLCFIFNIYILKL